MLIIFEAVQRLFAVNSAEGCNACVYRFKISAAYKTNSVFIIKHNLLRDHVNSFVIDRQQEEFIVTQSKKRKLHLQ